MDITLPEDAARRILIAYGVARDECQAPEFDDILIAIAAQHPGLAQEFSYLPWPKRGGRDIPGTIGEPILKPSTLKRAYTQAELDAAVMAERERWIGGARVSIPTDTMEQEIAAHVRRAVAAERERMNRHAVTLAETARVVEQERCAALVDPMGWESLHPSDGEYLVLDQAARKIRGD